MAETRLTEDERTYTLGEILQAHRVEQLGFPGAVKCHACDDWTQGTIHDHHADLALAFYGVADLAARLARVEALCAEAERVKASHDKALRRMDPDHRPCESTSRALFARRVLAALAPAQPVSEPSEGDHAAHTADERDREWFQQSVDRAGREAAREDVDRG